jgi:hypothetical protein
MNKTIQDEESDEEWGDSLHGVEVACCEMS